MSNIFKQYPLPWSTGVNLNTQKPVIIDALNKEVNLNNPEVVLGLKQMADNLTNSAKRRLGWSNKSEQLFVIKNTENGTYGWRDSSIVRTQYFRSRYQAQKAADRLNYRDGNPFQKENVNAVKKWVVVELEVKEKK